MIKNNGYVGHCEDHSKPCAISGDRRHIFRKAGEQDLASINQVIIECEEVASGLPGYICS